VGGRGDAFLEALLAVDGWAGAHGALQFNDIAVFAGHFGNEPFAGHAAFEHLIGGNRGQVEVFGGVDAAVEQDDRNFGFLGFGQNVVPAGSDDRRDQD